MRKLILIAALAATALAPMGFIEPAKAQQTYPTAAGGVRVQGTVPLQCNASGVSCAPVSGANPTATAGDVASGTADSGNPVKVGGVYNAALPTLTTGQRGSIQLSPKGSVNTVITNSADGALAIVIPSYADAMNPNDAGLQTNGRNAVYDNSSWIRQRGDYNGTIVQPALAANLWSYAAAASGIVNTTVAVTIKAAQADGRRNFICTLNVGHDTLGAATEFVVRDGAAGTVLYRMKLQTAANEGLLEINFSPCLRGSVNTLIEVVTLTASVSGGVFVNSSGFIGN